jgi:hypothetical protein
MHLALESRPVCIPDCNHQTKERNMSARSLIHQSAKASLIFGGIWLSTLPVSTTGAIAQADGKACMAVFERNKSAIEGLAGTPGSEAKIRAIMAKGGCKQSNVSVAKKPAGTPPNARIRWSCDASAPPFRIRCSIGSA